MEAGEGEGWPERGVISEGIAPALAPGEIMLLTWIVVWFIDHWWIRHTDPSMLVRNLLSNSERGYRYFSIVYQQRVGIIVDQILCVTGLVPEFLVGLGRPSITSEKRF